MHIIIIIINPVVVKFRIQKFHKEIFQAIPSSKRYEVGHSTYCTT